MNASADDFELLQAWRAGDDHAGNALLRRHFDALFRFFRARIDDGVGDLVQRTMLAAVEARDRLPATSFRAYLFGIAHNLLMMELRRIVGRRVVPGDDHDAPAPSVGSPSRDLLRHEEQRLLLRALRELPVELQVVLQLHYWERLGTAEIGEIVGVPAGTVKSRLFRARQQVKQSLAAMSPVAGRESTINGFESWARSLGAALERER